MAEDTAVVTPVTPVVTPAVTPVVTPAVTPAVVTAPIITDPNAVAAVEAPAVSLPPMGDAALDLAVAHFHKLGLTLESPEMVEAGKGNFSYLEAKLAALGDKAKGSEGYLAIAKEAQARIAGSTKEAYEARKKAVHDAVGGEETWKSVEEFVKANADEKELSEVKEAIAQGGMVAKAMAEMLHRQFLATPGTTVNPADPTRNVPASPANGAPLTHAGYRTELESLVAKIGSHRLDDSPEYKALRQKYANVRS